MSKKYPMAEGQEKHVLPLSMFRRVGDTMYISGHGAVDENGNVNLFEINSANTDLKNYVANTLKEMKIKNAVATEKFVLVVKFRVA